MNIVDANLICDQYPTRISILGENSFYSFRDGELKHLIDTKDTKTIRSKYTTISDLLMVAKYMKREYGYVDIHIIGEIEDKYGLFWELV